MLSFARQEAFEAWLNRCPLEGETLAYSVTRSGDSPNLLKVQCQWLLRTNLVPAMSSDELCTALSATAPSSTAAPSIAGSPAPTGALSASLSAGSGSFSCCDDDDGSKLGRTTLESHVSQAADDSMLIQKQMMSVVSASPNTMCALQLGLKADVLQTKNYISPRLSGVRTPPPLLEPDTPSSADASAAGSAPSCSSAKELRPATSAEMPARGRGDTALGVPKTLARRQGKKFEAEPFTNEEEAA